MNMRLPKSLRDKDPMLAGVQLVEGALPVEVSENDWTDEEIEDFEREVEQQLLEEEFIAACFEEMWAEEEAQWQFYVNQQSSTNTTFVTVYYSEPQAVLQTEPKNSLVAYSKLNPEAPEFVPRGFVP